jgi:hypothetical protein
MGAPRLSKHTAYNQKHDESCNYQEEEAEDDQPTDTSPTDTASSPDTASHTGTWRRLRTLPGATRPCAIRTHILLPRFGAPYVLLLHPFVGPIGITHDTPPFEIGG